jgi:apolipoprotein N-acyltransferase
LFWLARNKPWWLVILTGLLLAASFPPSPLNPLIFVAFLPLFVLFEEGVIPARVPEDKVFKPLKAIIIITYRLLSLQFIWRKQSRGLAVFRYQRKYISGNAQLFRYSYAALLIWNALCCYWLMLTATKASSIPEGVINTLAGIIAISLNPLLMTIPLQFYSRLRHFLPVWLAAPSLVIFWITFEYLHLNWELSWSWLNLGNALSFWPSWIQYAEFTGVLGISAHILIANLLVYYFYRMLRAKAKGKILAGSAALLWILLPLAAAPMLSNPGRDIFIAHDSMRVRIIQPNVDPYKKDNYYTAEAQVALFEQLILSRPLDSNTLVMLPERAITRAQDPAGIIKGRLMQPLWHLVDSFHIEILTGLEDYQTFPDTVEPPLSARQGYRFVNGKRKAVFTEHYNSALLMGADREMKLYRKDKLVPMVERMPFLGLVKALKFLHMDPSQNFLSFGRADSLHPLLARDSTPLNVFICYESAFGDHSRQKTLQGAELLTMITNDGWWRHSSGYVQHAGLSVIRAIENRRALARCANNGTSMFVSARGQISQATDWWEPTIIEEVLPLYRGQTFYVRHGDFVGKIAAGLAILLSLAGIVLHYLRNTRQKT